MSKRTPCEPVASVIQESVPTRRCPIDDLHGDLHAFAVRCRTDLFGHLTANFSDLYTSADHLRTRLVGTDLEALIAPLWTNLHLCAGVAHEVAHIQNEGAALELRMRMIEYRDQVLQATEAILRTTGETT
jgi:hypothetical protein